jgi:hypothetical protein
VTLLLTTTLLLACEGTMTGPGTDPDATTGRDGGARRDGAIARDDAGSSDAGAPGPDAGRPPPDPCIAAGTCPPGTWIEVTPPEMADLEFGGGPIVVDPARPSDLYLGGGGDGIWKSTDYGNTWTQVDDTIGYVPMGLIIAVAGTMPEATVWVAGFRVLYKSEDGGETFREIEFPFERELYSIDIDPYDDRHLISGLHEADGIVESTDGGETWTMISGSGFPSGGVSWYPFFIDTGDAATTRETWFAIAQGGGSATITRDGGGSWTIPTGVEGLTHAHGNAQIFQRGSTIFVPGVDGPGQGMYRSTDYGATFTRVAEGALAIAWGTDENVYGMWGWACSGCDLGASFTVAPLPDGTEWTRPAVPAGLVIGANHMAVTSDGTHDVFVGTMWSSGIWRYVEP